MKALIVALNSKYIHSALAPWYLKAACGEEHGQVCVIEHTINENLDDVLAAIYMQKPDIAAFSCYVWNISFVLKLTESLKKLMPGTVIVLGGPEVSYESADLIKENAFIDFVLAGEGEKSFPAFIQYCRAARIAISRNSIGISRIDGISSPSAKSSDAIKNRSTAMNSFNTEEPAERSITSLSEEMGDLTEELEHIDGLVYRSKEGIIVNVPAMVDVLDDIPSPYTQEMLSALKNKIVYFESSRGCPFSCSYCLSSASEGTRYFSLDRVFAELDRLVAAGVRQIKFVDRTFNANKKRAAQIIRHIIELDSTRKVMDTAAGTGIGVGSEVGIRSGSGVGSNTAHRCNFHFEVGADLFDEELLCLLASAPRGLFQLEAGVQSTNEQTLAAVCRKTNLERLLNHIMILKRNGNIHIHADLIAGLPYEDYVTFANSFDRLYAVGPHQLQLGFLKFLKGTRLKDDAALYGYQYNSFPPYEILSGKYISYDELIVLKGMAELVERYYNSARFVFSLKFIIDKCFQSPFRFFEQFYYFHRENDQMESQAAFRELYRIFSSFASRYMNDADHMELCELLRLDFLASDKSGTLPGFLDRRTTPGFADRCFDYLKNTDQIVRMIPEAAGMSPKQLYKSVHFEMFHFDVEPLSTKTIDRELSDRGLSEMKPLEMKPLEIKPLNIEQSLIYHPAKYSVLVFSYFQKDPVTGQYPFHITNI